mgnify:CR=1 FL=1
MWRVAADDSYTRSAPPDPVAEAPAISIHDAATDGDIEVVQQHLVAGADVNVKDAKGKTAIQLAVENKHGYIVKYLIKNGADLSVKNDEGEILKDKDGNPKKNYWHNNPTRRAFTYKSLNKLIQGSAADMTKKAMLELYKEGIIPHIQIHDELDLSVESSEHADKIRQIMENAVDLQIPNKVDYESGPNWGTIK